MTRQDVTWNAVVINKNKISLVKNPRKNKWPPIPPNCIKATQNVYFLILIDLAYKWVLMLVPKGPSRKIEFLA